MPDPAARIGHSVAKTGQASHRAVATGDGVLPRAPTSGFGLSHAGGCSSMVRGPS
jgi:hypothetical protein